MCCCWLWQPLIWWFEHKRNPEQFGGGTAAGIGSVSVVCGHHDHSWLWRQSADYPQGTRRCVYLDADSDYHRICLYSDDHNNPHGSAPGCAGQGATNNCPRCMSVRSQAQPATIIAEQRILIHFIPNRIGRACALSRRARLKRWYTMPQFLRYLIHQEFQGDSKFCPKPLPERSWHRQKQFIA